MLLEKKYLELLKGFQQYKIQKKTPLKNGISKYTPAMASQVVVMTEEEKQLFKKLQKVERKNKVNGEHNNKEELSVFII